MIHPVDDISIVGPSGELDSHEGKMLLEKIANLIRYEWNKIVLDLREVNHIHFRFLSELSLLSEISSHRAGGIKLANLNHYTKALLKVVGVEGRLETYDSVAEAILSFDRSFIGSSGMQ